MLKENLQSSWNETGFENDSTKWKRGSTGRRKEGGGELLGKVTVIRRAHRVISHKAAEACTSPLPKLSVKYILPLLSQCLRRSSLPAFLLIVYTLSNLSAAVYNYFHFFFSVSICFILFSIYRKPFAFFLT